jgi:hypothetical protein
MARCGGAGLGQLAVPSSTPSGYADAVTVGGIEVALSAVEAESHASGPADDRVTRPSPSHPEAAIGRHPA